MPRLMHDHARAGSRQILAMVAHLLREEEHADARQSFYEALKGIFHGYEADAARERHRLPPVIEKNVKGGLPPGVARARRKR